jgi:hypothetical protein
LHGRRQRSLVLTPFGIQADRLQGRAGRAKATSL